MQGDDWTPYVVVDLDGPVKLITGQNPQVRTHCHPLLHGKPGVLFRFTRNFQMQGQCKLLRAGQCYFPGCIVVTYCDDGSAKAGIAEGRLLSLSLSFSVFLIQVLHSSKPDGGDLACAVQREDWRGHCIGSEVMSLFYVGSLPDQHQWSFMSLHSVFS
jgi:hypothetical protein